METERDYILVEDEDGTEKQFVVEALFDIEDKTYAFLRSEEDKEDTIVMEVEDDGSGQYLIGIDDPEEVNMVLDAYEVVLHADKQDS
ncbi:DUF1292 domain-containing protein [Metabacillus fastidiosus]|uniref:DUF1292 domain-containing protein n=1 Tax=Metabacillus fastidiosus TaxID=1458 RepID=UPI002E1A6781|nr:DUF1292 domain-containing protein [Metabacillus fastidiosus]